MTGFLFHVEAWPWRQPFAAGSVVDIQQNGNGIRCSIEARKHGFDIRRARSKGGWGILAWCCALAADDSWNPAAIRWRVRFSAKTAHLLIALVTPSSYCAEKHQHLFRLTSRQLTARTSTLSTTSISITCSSSTSRDHMPEEVCRWRTKRCN